MFDIRSGHPLAPVAEKISRDVLLPAAADVDAQSRFPAESVDALRGAGLLKAFVPARFGGYGADLPALCDIAATLGASCLSTAFIWAQHSQQVAALADHATDQLPDVLDAIARQGILAASVTTEYGKGGDLLLANSPLLPFGDMIRVLRDAPVVSYGREAGLYLVTMRASADRPPQDVRLAVVTADDGVVTTRGQWNAMGMRGTQSVPMHFDARITPDRVIQASFRTVATMTFIPFAHIGWAACWYGAAWNAFVRFVSDIRRSERLRDKALRSDHFTIRVAEARSHLDLFGALLSQVMGHVHALRRSGAPCEAYETASCQIALNNLKIAGSRLAISVVDGLIDLCGMSGGYTKADGPSLERTLRDLRAAPLMYHNDRLLEANGRLAVLEHAAAGLLA